MLFFRKKDRDPAAEQRKDAGLAALTRGEITPEARGRLESGVRSSTFSCGEFLLARQGGAEHLGVVMGSAFYTLALPLASQRNRHVGELAGLTEAHRSARTLALDRLRAEASALGAHGVVGVELKWKRSGWGESLVECTAIGTAVRLAGAPPVARPFTSNLSGDEFWLLHDAGYTPQDLVFGVSAYLVSCDDATYRVAVAPLGAGWRSQEVESYTRGFMAARDMAASRLRLSVKQSDGEGAVGMTVEHHFEELEYELGTKEYLDLLITFTAVGTSVASRVPDAPAAPRAPLICYDLASGASRPLEVPPSAPAPETH